MVGPLAAFAPGFSAELVARGYRPRSAAAQLALMADVSRWLADHGLDERDLSEARVEELMAHRRVSGPATLLSSRAIVPLLEYLRSVGAAPPAVTVPATTAAEELVERYATYLRDRRGLARSTVRNYLWVARVFLGWREATAGALDLERLDAAAVSEFVLEQAARSCVGTAKCMVTRLRVLLRFLHVEGEIEHTLSDAVPSVAGWRLAGLIKALDSRSVARLLAGCDRRTHVGRRDFAIVVLLSRLGLRAGEVAALQLVDIDWRAGEIMVRGKGSRQERLPLPAQRHAVRLVSDRLHALGSWQLQAFSDWDREGGAAGPRRADARASLAAAHADAGAGRRDHSCPGADARSLLVRAAGADGDACWSGTRPAPQRLRRPRAADRHRLP